MATGYTDWSGVSAGTVASDSATTGITDFTWAGPGGSASYWRAEIVTASGAPAGKACKISQYSAGWGNAHVALYVTALGSLSAGTAAQIVFQWKVDAIPSASFDYFNLGRIRLNTSSISQYYAQAFRSATQFRLGYFSANNYWSDVGSLITKSPAANTWYWTRIDVTAGGSWSWRSWADGGAEPGSWDVSAVSDTSYTSGALGIGNWSQDWAIDYGYFGWATAGDTAPAPAGSSTPIAAIAGNHSRRRRA